MKLKEPIKDLEYRPNLSVTDLLEQYGNLGYQATHLKKAADIVLRMINEEAGIIFTFTSNMVTSGLRGLFAEFIKRKLVHAVITTVGSIEEDFIKAKRREGFFVGSFDVDDRQLGEEGINRVGNIFVPNETYASFEDYIQPVFEELVKEKRHWPAWEFFKRLGEYTDDPRSILHQAAKNDVPIICPAPMDGALGMQTYFFKVEEPDFEILVTKDLGHLVNHLAGYDKLGALVLGGGVSKHFAILTSLLRDGLDYAVYMTTARPYAGSLSGATTEEAKSWGKIRGEADAITVHGDVTLTFPILATYVLDKLDQ